MSSESPTTSSSDSPQSAAGRGLFADNLKRRLLIDRLAAKSVTLGGWIIIACILAILLVIVIEFFPLFKSPSSSLEKTIATGEDAPALAVGMDEYVEVAYRVDASGIHFYSLKTGEPFEDFKLEGLGTAQVTAVSQGAEGSLVLGLSDGRILPVDVQFESRFENDVRTIVPSLKEKEPVRVREDEKPVTRLTHSDGEEGNFIAAVSGPASVVFLEVIEKTNLMGVTKRKMHTHSIDFPVKGNISALIIDAIESALIVGTSSGQILRASTADLDSETKVEVAGATRSSGVGVTRFDFLLGGYTLVMGDSEGGVTSYQWLRRDDGKRGLRKIYDFTPHEAATVFFEKSQRTKGFLSGSAESMNVHYGTTGETQLNLMPPEGVAFQAFSMSPKADAVLASDTQGDLLLWTLDNHYPQITLRSVFGKTQYEGYEEPTYVWQSTGGSDAFESKFSLVPLVFGTLKGTFYAMLFAVPLAILGAFYTSQFMHTRLKGIVKPTIELMAALPSVVLGFFAALIVAPEVERWLPGIIMMPFVIIIMVLAALLVYEGWDKLYGKIPAGMEISFLIPLTLVAGLLSVYFGKVVEVQFMFGDHRTFWNEVFNITYDQRNALVVGLAMGFAVIPLIFTITEDSLSNVPEHLRASSLALGATPWQTAIRVILPTASPGIFSAIMIGFGRAVGETMIVLMATGNTPVMEWSMFNGFRALSANIAVELPEAPEGGTLFRLLFLAAFLLFVMTFFINTLAEVVRLRLRKRYRVL